jgi:redox-sensitive bicupin YhaK (pirin superfamily)
VVIHQDVAFLAATLAPGERVRHTLASGRHSWIQVVRGAVDAGGVSLSAGDGVAVSDEPALELAARAPTEMLLFDLA